MFITIHSREQKIMINTNHVQAIVLGKEEGVIHFANGQQRQSFILEENKDVLNSLNQKGDEGMKAIDSFFNEKRIEEKQKSAGFFIDGK